MADTVTPQRKPEGKSGMGMFGWLMFAGMAIVLAPLLPIYLLLKLYFFNDTATTENDETNKPQQSPR